MTVTARQVTARCHYVEGHAGVASAANQGFNSNAGFVVTAEGVVVVDALGTVPLGRALVAAIRGQTTAPIRRVVVTHYHADHVYGLAALQAAGADIWAHHRGREYLQTQAETRLAQRRRDLAPWVDAQTRLVPADRWLDGDVTFALGGATFDVVYMGPAHAPDDVLVSVREEGVIFCGDIITSGRVPFVGDADTRRWLAAIDRFLALRPRRLVPGHGPASTDPQRDLAFTRDYIRYLRDGMGRAVADMLPFDEAYARVDWSRYAHVPAFEAANRINAYGSYLQMERESLGR